jgi:uncharacterized membrane protein
MKSSITIRIYIILTCLVAFWCAGIITAPLLKQAGLHSGAEMVYSAYSRICHQADVRSFHVGEEKFGVCIRCSAIYFGFLAGLLLLPLSGVLNKRRIPKPIVLVAVMIPMMVDVLLNDIGLHFSTTMTRVTTGLLFGGVMPWCIVPLLDEACSQVLTKKKIHSPDSGVRLHVRKTQ